MSTPETTHWGKLIRKLRLRADLTQDKLGRIVVLGREGNVSRHPQHLISRYESTANPSANNVVRLLAALGYEIKLRKIKDYPDQETRRILEDTKRNPRVTPYRKAKDPPPETERAPLAPTVGAAMDAPEEPTLGDLLKEKLGDLSRPLTGAPALENLIATLDAQQDAEGAAAAATLRAPPPSDEDES